MATAETTEDSATAAVADTRNPSVPNTQSDADKKINADPVTRDKLLRSDAHITTDMGDVLTTVDDFHSRYKAQLSGRADFPERDRRYAELLGSLSQDVSEMGVAQPKVVVDSSNLYSESIAASFTSKEGTNYIAIRDRYLANALASDEGLENLKGILGHETAHIRNGDTEPAGIIRNRDRAALLESESLADLTGAGPLGTRNPEAFARYQAAALREAIADYNNDHPDAKIPRANPTPDELQAVSDWNARVNDPKHPALLDRIADLKKEAALMTTYEGTHPVITHADREEESRWVIEKVKEDAKNRDKAKAAPAAEEPAIPKSGAVSTLSDSQRMQIQDISDTWNQVQQTPVDLPAPPAKAPSQDLQRGGI